MTVEKPHKYATIGNRIYQIRSKFNLSQAKFAVNIGISQRFLSDLETGRIKPSKPTLLAIEYVYKYRKEWILTGDEPIYVDALNPPQVMPHIGYETSDRQLRIWINKLIRIFEEGDKVKLEAIKAQLRAFDPGEKEELIVSEEKLRHNKNMEKDPITGEWMYKRSL